MVVDDSAVSRRALRRALEDDSAIEVVATARNGKRALEKLESVAVDAVVLDLQMPVMGGMEFLEELRSRDSELPVVIVSAYTPEGAPETIQALLQGAGACIAKPSGEGGSEESRVASLGDELSACLRSIVESPERDELDDDRPGAEGPGGDVPQHPDIPETGSLPTEGGAESESHIDVIGVGVSTGGPAALVEVLEPVPADVPIPILVVQHMPAAFTAQLAVRLDAELDVGVQEATNGAPLEESTVWIAPGDRHMEVERGADGVSKIELTSEPKVNSCRPSADVLFRSLAEEFGSGVLGVVMTGMGRDGLEGARAIHRAGGSLVVQDEASSVAWGMPRSCLEAGIVDRVLSLRNLGQILRRAGANGRSPRASVTPP